MAPLVALASSRQGSIEVCEATGTCQQDAGATKEHGPVLERGIDPAALDRGKLTVSYWNGFGWQPEVCAIPQAE